MELDSLGPILPVEIIYYILHLLNPQELLPLKRVSRRFRAIISDRAFWRIVYAGAHLLRPPGPFAWQSTEFFQRTLVRSARLAQRWTSQPINVVSTHSLKLGFDEDCKWVDGRWLIICKGGRQLVLHDIDTGFEQTICLLGSKWVSWSATSSTMSTRGRLLYVGLCAGTGHSADRVRLLEFQVNDGSGHLSGPVTFDIAVSYSGGLVSLSLEGGDTPLVFISIEAWHILAHSLIFDTRSQMFYRFPRFRFPTHIPLSQLSCFFYEDIVLTTTHIIIFRRADDPKKALVQAYIIPNDGETHELYLSHETTIPHGPMSWSLLRSPVVDPITGSTCMRLLHCRHNQEFLCADLILPTNSMEDILPMSIATHAVFATSDVQDGTDSMRIQASTDGFARGLCVVTSILEERCIHKFSIDGTGELEQCVGVMSDRFSFSPCASELRQWRMDSFDGARGRICYTKDVVGYGYEKYAVAVDL